MTDIRQAQCDHERDQGTSIDHLCSKYGVELVAVSFGVEDEPLRKLVAHVRRDCRNEIPPTPAPPDEGESKYSIEELIAIGIRASVGEQPTPAQDYEPFTYGKRRRNPYYKAEREIWRYKDGKPVELMIAKDADVTDILRAWTVPYEHELGEVVAKILRLGQKPGTNVRHEIIKCHEHLQAAEDAWVAEQEAK